VDHRASPSPRKDAGSRAARPAAVGPRRLHLGVLLACALCGCRVHRVDPDPAPPVELPEGFARGLQGEEGRERWWEEFQDPELDRLVEQALAGNLDLRAAWARLDQAEAAARKAGASLWPTLRLDGGASRTQQTLQIGGPIGTVTSLTNQFSLSLAAAYELDLWGRIGAQRDGAALDYEATREDLAALAMTTAARVAETWFNLRERRAQLGLLGQQIQASRTFLELVELRFAQGQASALEVYQQRQQLAGLEAQVPPVEAAEALLGHQLAVLLGRAPGEQFPAGAAQLPVPPPLPASGIPAALAARRPDLRAARARVVAADHRLGAAIADLLPSIRLSGRLGYQAPRVDELLEDWVGSMAGSLAAPLFEGGQRRAEVDRARALREERLQDFGRILLRACQEVEDALVKIEKQEAYIKALERQLRIALDSLGEARSRYMRGLSDYLNVLTALAASQQVERNLLAARRDLLAGRIELCRALGGSWTDRLERAPDRPSRKGERS